MSAVYGYLISTIVLVFRKKTLLLRLVRLQGASQDQVHFAFNWDFVFKSPKQFLLPQTLEIFIYLRYVSSVIWKLSVFASCKHDSVEKVTLSWWKILQICYKINFYSVNFYIQQASAFKIHCVSAHFIILGIERENRPNTVGVYFRDVKTKSLSCGANHFIMWQRWSHMLPLLVQVSCIEQHTWQICLFLSIILQT